ncbi:MAG: HEAT repeat domain-containing protein, partial [Candidatus Heimdallarchaeaceae archaeon]
MVEDIRSLIEEGKTDQIKIQNMRHLNALVPLLTDRDQIIRKKATELLFSAPVIPIDKIIEKYLLSQDSEIENLIIEELPYFLTRLTDYSLQEQHSSKISSLFKKIPVKELYKTLVEVHENTPLSASKSEIIIRTCYPAFSDSQDSLITFDFILNNKKDIKKILTFRLNQQDPLITELVLKTVCLFPELASLIEKELRAIFTKSEVPEHILYATTALTNIQNQKNASILIERLEQKKDEEDVQLAIIEALGNIANPKIAKRLIEQFERGGVIADHVAKSLGMLGPEILPDLTQALENDHYVPYIIESMKRIGGASFDFLMQTLEREKNVKIRKNIAQCLTLVMNEKYGYKGAIKLLVNELAEKNPEIIDSVTQALITLGTPSIEVLIEEIKDKDLQVRKNAIKVLNYFGKMNIEIALDGLLEVDVQKAVMLSVILYVYHPDEELRSIGYSFAVYKDKIRAKKTDEIYSILEDALTEVDPGIRARACDILVFFKQKAVPKLANLLSDPNINVKRKAAESLRKIKNKRALISLMSAAEDKDVIVAEISTRALGELGDPGVIDTILANLKRSKDSIYEASVYALTQLGAPIVPRLARELNNSSKQVVQGVIESLSKMGERVLNSILPSVFDENDKWFMNFEQVIKMMGSKAILPLEQFYKQVRSKEQQLKILRLRAQAQDISIVEPLVSTIISSRQKKVG